MVGDIEIGNDIAERGSIEGKKKGAQDRACNYFSFKILDNILNYVE